MKTRSIICQLLVYLAVTDSRSWSQSSGSASLIWQGTMNEILALNVAYPIGATAYDESPGTLPVTLRVDSGPAVIANGMITVNGLGTVWVTAEQAGDATHAPARVSRSFNVRHAMLTSMGGVDTGGEAEGIHVFGNYAYIADGSTGLQVVDVSNPAKPTRVGAYDLSYSANAVSVASHFAFVADAWGGLTVVDISNPANPVWVGAVDFGGSATGLRPLGNFVLVANGTIGLDVIDVSNPAKPVRVGGIDTRGSAEGVDVLGSYAYIADGTAGLQVIDVSNPVNPVRVGGYDTIGTAKDVHVVGNYAFVADGEGGLRVIDVVNPARPMRVGAVETSGYAKRVHVVGNYAYVTTDTAGLQVIDVSNPVKPARVGGADIGVAPRCMQVVGNHAYIGDYDNGLRIFEIRLGYPQALNFKPPGEVSITNGFLGLPRTTSSGALVTYSVLSGRAKVEGDRLVFSGPGEVRLRAEQAGDEFYLPLQEEWTFRVIPLPQTFTWTGTTNEILDLNAPYPLGATSSSGVPVTLRVDSGPAVIANGTITANALGTVWVTAELSSDATYAPARESRSFNVGQVILSPLGRIGTTAASDVQVVGNYAFVADGNAGLQVIDVSNPASPVRVGGYDTSGWALRVKVVGNYAFVTDAAISTAPFEGEDTFLNSPGDGFIVLDISDPANPRRVTVTGLNLPSILDAHVAGKYAYVLDEWLGLVVVDVSNPTSPKRMGALESTGNNFSIARPLRMGTVENYAFVAMGSGELAVIDVSNPAKPVKVAVHSTGSEGEIADLQFAGNYAFLADSFAGLQVIDVSNPLVPRRVGGIKTSQQALSVDLVGNYVFVAVPSGGFQVFDVSSPVNPIPVGVVEGFRQSPDLEGPYGVRKKVFAMGNRVFVADGSSGMKILELRMGYPQTLTWKGTSNEILALGVPYPLSAMSSSELPVTLRVEAGPAVIADGKITVTGEGSVSVVAEQAGDTMSAPARMTRRFNEMQMILTPVGSITKLSAASRLQIVGNYAYVLEIFDGLQIIDISNLSSPKWVGAYKTDHSLPYGWTYASSFQVSGNHAFIAAHNDGLEVIDVSNPASPKRVGTYDTSGNAYGVQVVGNYAFVTDIKDTVNQALGDGLTVVDVSDPANPKRLSRLAIGSATDVHVVGNYAFVANNSASPAVVDVSNPSEPILVSPVRYRPSSWTGSTSRIIDVHVEGGYAFATSLSLSFPGTINFTTDNRLMVFDVNDPTSLRQIGEYKSDGSRIKVVGSYAFVMPSELEVLDVSNPAFPKRVESYAPNGTPAPVRGSDLQMVGDYIFVVSGTELQILKLRLGWPQKLEIQWPSEDPPQGSPVFSAGAGIPLNIIANSGLPVNLSVVSGPAIVNGNVITSTGVGEVTIRAEQPGNTQFLPATRDVTFKVTPKPLPFLLWQHAQGTIATWTMDRATRTAAALLTPSDPGDVKWRVVGAGDFDHDGGSDLLWRHADGMLAAWFMKDGVMQRATLLDANLGVDWAVGGVADFDRDGYPDILLVHKDGELGVWFMRGEKRLCAAFLSPSNAGDAKWKVMGAADFGADGHPDIVWQHDDGLLAFWHMDGLTLKKAELLERDVSADPLWRVAALTDLDNKGTPDLVFQRTDGYLAAWFMNGTKVINASMLDPLHPDPTKKDTSWRVVGP